MGLTGLSSTGLLWLPRLHNQRTMEASKSSNIWLKFSGAPVADNSDLHLIHKRTYNSCTHKLLVLCDRVRWTTGGRKDRNYNQHLLLFMFYMFIHTGRVENETTVVCWKPPLSKWRERDKNETTVVCWKPPLSKWRERDKNYKHTSASTLVSPSLSSDHLFSVSCPSVWFCVSGTLSRYVSHLFTVWTWASTFLSLLWLLL